ncbi:methionyl-tRNA formyltransferase [Sphingopyxis indica]|uniref:methionyl-tRNA formyltransferase n=1 Tax=Sphingopyxis indica TaxID=436663 RepID=UPI002938E2B2|nr:formyltransferase family protein [Sphingopyxis indica]WOF43568.1 methionyl-tRNA formyltransferase [Sphingopyxis indica]
MRKLIVVGAVESTEVAIRAASAAPGWRVAMVVTLPATLAARHSDFRDLSGAARACGAELLPAERINAPETLARIAGVAPDLLLVCGWSQICGPDFLALLPGRVLGYHPAALPRLRGRAAIPWTILNDEPITAGTLFWIDEGVDSGPVFEQRFFHVAPDETAASLYARHMDALAAMVARGLERLAAGDADGAEQDERCATHAARRRPADGRIDWSRPATEIERLIRATGRPYPGAFTLFGGERLTIWAASARPDDRRHLAVPGQVVAVDPQGLLVKTLDGLLHVRDWQADSEKRPGLHSVLGRETHRNPARSGES